MALSTSRICGELLILVSGRLERAKVLTRSNADRGRGRWSAFSSLERVVHRKVWPRKLADHSASVLLIAIRGLFSDYVSRAKSCGHSKSLLDSNPWLCLSFEAMEAFTLHLMWVSAVTYAASLTPPGLTATIQGTIGSIHYGVGRGLGSFIGGGLMAAFGPRMAFR